MKTIQEIINNLAYKLVNWINIWDIRLQDDSMFFWKKLCVNNTKEILVKKIEDCLSEELSDLKTVFKQYEELKVEKQKLNSDQELFELNIKKKEQELKIQYEYSIDSMKKSLELEWDEVTRKLISIELENQQLKEQLSFYKEQVKDFKDLAKDSYASNNEALKTISWNQANVIIK